MIKSIGIRAHDYGKMKSAELAKAVHADGLGSVQLALNKAIEGIETIDQPLLDNDLLAIGNDFSIANVSIAVLGCYLNYAHPDKAIREANIKIFKDHLVYGQRMNARVIGTETGSMRADYSYIKENHTAKAYTTFSDSLYSMLQTAEDLSVNIAVEPVWDHIIYSNECLEKLIKDMDSKRLKVILDPVNLLNVNNYKKHDDLVKQAFDIYGDRIQVIHAKDYKIEGQEIVEVSHGTGVYEYGFLTEMVKQGPESMDILLENADVSDIQRIRQLFGGDMDR